MIFNLAEIRKRRQAMQVRKDDVVASNLTRPSVSQPTSSSSHDLDRIKSTMALHQDSVAWIHHLWDQKSSMKSIVTAMIGPSGAGKSLIAQCLSKYVLKRKSMMRWSMQQDVPLAYEQLLDALAPLMIQSMSTTLILQDLDHYESAIDQLQSTRGMKRQEFWHRLWRMIQSRSKCVDILFIFQSSQSWHVREALRHPIINVKPLFVKLPTAAAKRAWLVQMRDDAQSPPKHLERHVGAPWKRQDLPNMISYHDQLMHKYPHVSISKMSMTKYVMLMHHHAVYPQTTSTLWLESAMMPDQQDALDDLWSTMHRITRVETSYEQLEMDVDHLGKHQVIAHLVHHDCHRMVDERKIDGRACRLQLYTLLDQVPTLYTPLAIHLMHRLDHRAPQHNFQWKSIASSTHDPVTKSRIRQQMDDPFVKLMDTKVVESKF